MLKKKEKNTNMNNQIQSDLLKEIERWQKENGGSAVNVPYIVPYTPYHILPCPSCGRCPTCGRGGAQVIPSPQSPWYGTYC